MACNLLANVPTIPLERLQITRQLMDAALPNVRISGFHRHIDSMHLPDPDDGYVAAAAAAIEAEVSHILT